jgi:hypothetical protein
VTIAANAESSEDPAGFFIVETKREQLIELAKHARKIRSIVSEVLPLEKGAQAYFPVKKKATPGKLVLRVSTL